MYENRNLRKLHFPGHFEKKFSKTAHDADVWVSANKNTLLMADKKVLLMHGTSLTDKHIKDY